MIVFDIETNGLLDELDRLHCICAKDLDSGEDYSFGPGEIEAGLELLSSCLRVAGHNVMGFDIPAIQKVYPQWKPKGLVRDTLVMSRLIFPDLKERDFVFVKRDPTFPKKHIGSHSLRAWGHRIKNFKDDYEGDFQEWTPEMQSYCEQDVEVTAALWDKLMSKGFSEESIQLEHDVQRIILEQEKHGFAFDVPGAAALYATLCDRRDRIDRELADIFPAWTVETPFTPKRNNKTKGYVAGVTVYKESTVEFNPGSRDHIAQKLREKYDWKPTDFTPEGKPQIDETVLEKLPYPEAKLLEERFLLTKRIGQIGEGRNSWLKLEKNGVLHGRVNTNGAVTGRMTHSHPNLAQVPSVRALYGEECRKLFKARPGYRLVGCDADALELRCLAGYMAIYDEGAYIKTVLEGKKEDRTDMHSINAGVLGCDRDTAKTWFYAFIYGAGDAKLGSILGGSSRKGKEARNAFLSSLPALRNLITSVQSRSRSRGYLLGLDGRKLAVRSDHAALNTLLQSAGAILMKRALVICEKSIADLDARFVANVHDEWQIEAKENDADLVGRRAAQSIRDAGTYYSFKCPLDAQYSVGANWAETH